MRRALVRAYWIVFTLTALALLRAQMTPGGNFSPLNWANILLFTLLAVAYACAYIVVGGGGVNRGGGVQPTWVLGWAASSSPTAPARLRPPNPPRCMYAGFSFFERIAVFEALGKAEA